MLKVITEGEPPVPPAEIQVHPESRNWFIHVPKAETFYSAELGFYDRSHNWHSVATSRRTLTPADDVAHETAAQFATIPSEVSFQQLLGAVQEFASENKALVEAIIELETGSREAREANTPPPGSEQASVESKAVPDQKDFPTVERQQRADSKTTHPLIAKLVERSRQQPSPPDWTPQQAARLEQLVHLDSFRRVWMGSLEITELIRRRLEKEISSIAAAELARSAPAAPELAGFPAISSPFGGELAPGRKFWFNVNAELIVYGATEPGATVTIGGRTIRLRPDGSFSYRFALPDGRYELPAAATSEDSQEQRQAILRFSRFSEYHGKVEAHPQDEKLKIPSAENV